MKIGFIGLGTMGLPMAHHLLKNGYELIIYNRTKEKMTVLAVTIPVAILTLTFNSVRPMSISSSSEIILSGHKRY